MRYNEEHLFIIVGGIVAIFLIIFVYKSKVLDVEVQTRKTTLEQVQGQAESIEITPDGAVKISLKK